MEKNFTVDLSGIYQEYLLAEQLSPHNPINFNSCYLPVDCMQCHCVYKIKMVPIADSPEGISTGLCPDCFGIWKNRRGKEGCV